MAQRELDKLRDQHAAEMARLRRTERQHVPGRWCADHLCARCYSAPTARRIEELEAEIKQLRDQHAAEMARLREAAAELSLYARHRRYCETQWQPHGLGRCDCGLEETRRLLLAL